MDTLLASPDGRALLAAEFHTLPERGRSWALDVIAFKGSGEHAPIVERGQGDPSPHVRQRAEQARAALEAQAGSK